MICVPRTRVRSWVVVALVALAGCGGGGDDSNGGKVAVSQTPPAITPEPCPPPVTADCVVEAPTRSILQMVGGRQSDYALSVRKGPLALVPPNPSSSVVDFRFSGGTTLEDYGSLLVKPGSSLHSDVVVQPGSGLTLNGPMTGNAINHGGMRLSWTLVGNLVNDGVLTPGSSIYGDVPSMTPIEGVFNQSPAGMLDAVIGATSGGVSVAGRADINGTVRLSAYQDDWGPYPLPTPPFSVHVLHADGGVFGQFASWTSPGLLITGNLRYLENDVFFDVSSISVSK